MKATFLLVSLAIATSCGQQQREGAQPGAHNRFLLRIADRNAMSWPASADFRSAAADDVSGLGSARLAADKPDAASAEMDFPREGFFAIQGGDALPWQRGRGRNLARGPWGATGLLDLPLIHPPRRCSPGAKWSNMAARISAYEAEYEIPRSAIALDAFDAFSGAVAVDPQECAAAALVDCLRAVFEAMPQLPRNQGESVAMLHPMFRYARHYNGCFRPTARVENPTGQSKVTFDIADGRMVFAPERVFSILIFSGVQESLAKALEQKAPVAVVPIPADCYGESESGACLESPLPLSFCNGCEKLVVGELYSVFLILRPGVLDEQILPVLLSIPAAE